MLRLSILRADDGGYGRGRPYRAGGWRVLREQSDAVRDRRRADRSQGGPGRLAHRKPGRRRVIAHLEACDLKRELERISHGNVVVN